MTDLTAIKNDSLLTTFFDASHNPDFDLVNFDFFDKAAEDALKWSGIEDKKKVLERLKGYHRLLNLGLTGQEAKTLLDPEPPQASDDASSPDPAADAFMVPSTPGPELDAALSAERQPTKVKKLDSAVAIASLPEEKFIQASGLDPAKAKVVHQNASKTVAGEMVLFANIMEVASPRYETAQFDNSESLRNSFKSLPSYQNLFGSQNFLQCDPCQSIFSPAAYFVDLMRLCDQKITQKNQKSIPDGLRLDQRRPDLFNKLQLTCDETKNTVPYTQIINEVLEEKLKNDLGQDVFKYLATADYPRNLPFNLNLETIRTYLGHLNTNLAEIYQICTPQDSHNIAWAREFLGLSPEQYTLITTSQTNPDSLKKRYGIETNNAPGDDLWGLVEKDTFLKQIKLSWQELNDLFSQNLSSEESNDENKKGEIQRGLAHRFYINRKLLDNQYLHIAYDDQKKTTVLQNLRLDELDRIDRFVRLAQKLNWSFADLDWVLTSMGTNGKNAQGAQKDIDEATIITITKIKQLQAQTKLPLDVLCSFWHDIKTIGKGDNKNKPQDLFNRVFNNPFISPGAESLNLEAPQSWKWEIDKITDEEQQQKSRLIRQRLLGALKLRDEDLTKLAKQVWGDSESLSSQEQTEQTPGLILNLSNLSKLFRSALILQLLQINIDEYQLLLKSLNKLPQRQDKLKIDQLQIDQLIEVIDIVTWLKGSGLNIYELDYILYGTEHPSVEALLPEEKLTTSMQSLWPTAWQLSPEEYKLITTEDPKRESLNKRFQVQIGNEGDDTFGGLTNKQVFLDKIALSESKLKELLSNQRFYINQPLPDKTFVSLDEDVINNLNLRTLDRIDRFLRLARATGWSFADLDRVLTILSEKYSDREAMEKAIQIKQSQTPLDQKLQGDVLIKLLGKISQEFNVKLAHHFGIEPELFAILAQIGANAIEEKDYIQLLLTQVDTEKEDWQKITACLKSISRWHLLVKKLSLTETTLRSIFTCPKAYNIDSSYTLNIQNIQTIYKCKNNLLKVFRGSEENLFKFFNEGPSPFRYWPLDEGEGHQEVLEQTNKSSNRLDGNFTWKKSTDFPGSTLRNVLIFHNQSTSIKIGLASSLKLIESDFTVEAWVNPQYINRYSHSNPLYTQSILGVISTGMGDESNALLSLGISGNKVQLTFNGGHLNGIGLIGKKELENNKWYHVVWRYDASTEEQAIFINGVIDAVRTEAKPLQEYGQEVYIGFSHAQGWNHFDGYITDLRIWNKALSNNQISELFKYPTISSRLAQATGWPLDKIDHAVVKNKTDALYKSVEGLLKIGRCIILSDTLGCSVDFLGVLCDLVKNSSAAENWETYKQVANAVISLTKAKHNDEEWTKVFKKLNGTLEERKTKILTGFALHKLGFDNLRKLSEYLLLDVEMTSCAFNSRIQLGILSLQTYLQRCRMGVETGIIDVDIPEVWWEWIPNYRKWEANRKVFLYPENYIDPSLRKDASPQFKELQDELLQSDITADTVETAYRHYFDKLTEISNLKIVDACRSSVKTPKSKEMIDTLFLFGKTVAQPHTYYYRHCERPTSKKPSWSYWEKIELPIDSDYISSVYAFNRLFIFWVEIDDSRQETKTKKGKSFENKEQAAQKSNFATLSVKYSFLNASQNWVSPQILVEGVPFRFFKFDKIEIPYSFWQKIHPAAMKNENSEVIALLFGDLKSVPKHKLQYREIAEKIVGPMYALKQLTKGDSKSDLYYPVINKNLKIGEAKINDVFKLRPGFEYFSGSLTNFARFYLVAITPALTAFGNENIQEYTLINSKSLDLIVNSSQQDFYLLQDNEHITIKRLSTSLPQLFSQTLLTHGIDGLISLASQQISEPNFPFVPDHQSQDFDDAYGAYFWEIFFHIPFLIASNLNSHQRYNEARQWYQYIFNPTQLQLPKAISSWSLDEKEKEGATIYDKERKLDGTLHGEAQWENVGDFPGAASKSVLKFNGANTRIELANARSLSLYDSDFTVEVWIKFTQPITDKDYSILGMVGTQSLNNRVFHLIIRNNKLFMSFYGNDCQGNTAIQTDKWYQTVWRYTKLTQEQAIFIDGRLDASSSGRQPFKGTETVSLGAYAWGTDGATWFEGHMTNVRIWNVPLSNEQILQSFEDVTVTTPSDRFWRFLPFRGQSTQKLKQLLTNDAAIQAYKENPFDPHAIASLRIGAYQKAVVMKYIDNLLDWGDALFTKDTWEDISQATTLYLLAYELLGAKPRNLGDPPEQKTKTFADLRDRDLTTPTSEFLLNLEDSRKEYQEFIKQFGTDGPFNALDTYFCISENQEFAQYWDRVEDRLFKIRHCQNIKGIERQLALFSPPIDPRQLVQQSAAGANILSLSMADVIPHYRFSYLLERSKSMASTVIQLGSTLLSTLEKKDAEKLALLRATQEHTLLQLVTKTKEKQIEEAKVNLESLNKSLSSASDRQRHYQTLIDNKINIWEVASLALSADALRYQLGANVLRIPAIAAYVTPTIFGASTGGMQPGSAISTSASVMDSIAGSINQGSSMASILAQYQRRQEDWELQQKMADWELQQLAEQIKAAQVRIEIAKAELDVHHKSIQHSQQVEQFLKDKYTNKELYQWMVGRLSSLYFQTYKVALEMANAAQKAYQYELRTDNTYIQPTHWDSQKKGLLAGESLMLGLNQLEKAYLDSNERTLEIEKTISLRQLNPLAFLKLIQEGNCNFNFDEKLFALDFPSHYCRQIKTISVSIPAVVGPYQNINATLTQTGDKVLIKPDPKALQWLLTGDGEEPDTGTIRQSWRQHQQIAISKGTNDSGLFVLNFQDERYLPFEGTGTISSWKLDLPKASNAIDFNSITDVIITLSYTALEGGSTIKETVSKHFGPFTGQFALDLKQELHQAAKDTNELSFPVSPNLFRHGLQKLKVSQVHLLWTTSENSSAPVTLEIPGYQKAEITPPNEAKGVYMLTFEPKPAQGGSTDKLTQPWKLSSSNLQDTIELAMIVTYEGTINWGNQI
ncbi:Tc toxin subunit A-related protein [Leptothoe spongobia]|uniref:LamG-like jellyroll fold domain-containing protein n=1 Tax=Leptothoe spongobia TAU-MAC 1115 TaxID=1967444 RepID=A0A947DBP9_9CYAN|nr:LamG-like jellyroll fold domain-containing protein [Leptothoe spongobia]MBT9313998.1 hypothetical protein [Leptothoe spongobia TAU-MAC 1115]